MRYIFAFTLAALAAAGETNLRPFLEAGHFHRVRALSEQRLKANPNDAEAAYALSYAKYKSGDLDGAAILAEKAVSLNNKDAEYHNLLAQLYGMQAQNATVFRQIGLARRCKKELDATLAVDPKHFEAQVTLMLFSLKAPAIVGGDRARARSIPDSIIKYDPANGYLAKIRLLQEDGRREEAADLYRKAADADPKNYRAQTSYIGYLLSQTKELDDAERRARQLIQDYPDRFDGYTFLAARLALAERWAEMDAVLQESRKRCPDNLQPFFNTARMLMRAGKELKRAEEYLNLYLSQEPEYSMPPTGYAHWLLGLVFEKEGRKPEAIAEIEKCSRMLPQFENAKKDLKRLRS